MVASTLCTYSVLPSLTHSQRRFLRAQAKRELAYILKTLPTAYCRLYRGCLESQAQRLRARLAELSPRR
jgi:hypothetical protein